MRDHEHAPELAGGRSRMMAELPSSLYVLASHLTAVLLRAGVADHVTLPVQSADEHWSAMLVTTRLICAFVRRLITSGCYVPPWVCNSSLAEVCCPMYRFYGLFSGLCC